MSTPPISTPTQTWQDWLKERLQLNLSMHHSTEIGNSLQRFEEALFSTSSRVTALICKQPANEPRRKFGDHDDFKRFLPDVRQSFEAFFVNKIGVSDDGKTPDSQSTSKLQLSREAFRYLSERCHLDIGFLYALSRSYLPAPRSFRSETDGFTSWYLVPIRIQVGCNDTRGQHATSTAGSNQMNPFHYLHLPRPGAADNGHGHPPVDIRGSHLAVHFSIRSSSNNENTDNSSSISLFVVNFLDGRYGKLIEEPRQRIQEALKGRAGNPAALDAQDVHIIIFSSVSRWWTNALQSINDQLVEHEKTLQEVADRTSNDENGAYFATLNKALHATAAHLHRYDSELTSILSTLGLLQARMQDRQDHRHLSFDDWGVTISQFEAVLALSHELEKKLKNILALVSARFWPPSTLSDGRIAVQSYSNRLRSKNGRKQCQDARDHASSARRNELLSRNRNAVSSSR